MPPLSGLDASIQAVNPNVNIHVTTKVVVCSFRSSATREKRRPSANVQEIPADLNGLGFACTAWYLAKYESVSVN